MLRAIGEELGGLPLALHVAGSYLHEYQRVLMPEQLLAELQRADALARKVLSGELGSGPLVLPTQHDRNVYRTFQLSYGKLDETRVPDALALQLLACARVWRREPVPHDLLAAMILPNDPSIDDRIQAEDALARLTGLGLLETALEQPTTFRLHRLLMRFVRKAREAAMAGARERVEQVVLAEAERVNATELVRPLAALLRQLRFVRMLQWGCEGRLVNGAGQPSEEPGRLPPSEGSTTVRHSGSARRNSARRTPRPSPA